MDSDASSDEDIANNNTKIVVNEQRTLWWMKTSKCKGFGVD